MDIEIAGRKIGPDHPPYIVAEMSGNHNGDIKRALAIIKAAKEAGADAVKLQTYTADTITIDHDGPGFVVEGTTYWDGRTLYDLFDEAHTPWEWHPRLFEYGREIGITIFSAAFDPTAVDFLESLNTPVHKIASYEIIDLPLVKKMAETKKPLIVSTGMASCQEIQDAVSTAHDTGSKEIILLHCVSGYPTPPEESNLRMIRDKVKQFRVACGLSDHSLGTAVAVASVAMGAVMIEKHFTLSRADGGVDSGFSIEPHELKQLVRDSRIAWQALGSVDYEMKDSEKGTSKTRRSLYVVKDIKKDERITEENVRSIRPGLGMLPKYLPDVLGKRAVKDLKFGTPLSWEILK